MVSDVPVSSTSENECRLKVTKSVADATFVHTAIKRVVIKVLVVFNFIRVLFYPALLRWGIL